METLIQSEKQNKCKFHCSDIINNSSNQRGSFSISLWFFSVSW